MNRNPINKAKGKGLAGATSTTVASGGSFPTRTRRCSRVCWFCLPVILALLLTACPQSTLSTVSKAVQDIAIGTNSVQTIAIQANQQGLISQADTATILTVCAQINAADVQASALTRNATTLAPGTAATIQGLLMPLAAAVQTAISSGVGNIKDAKTKTDITAAFALIQTGLAAAEAVLQ